MTKPWWTRTLLGRTAVSNPLQDGVSPDPQFEGQWRQIIKKRLFAVFAVLALWVVGLEARLVWLQVVSHEYWADKAKDQQQRYETIEAPRGTILDRQGRILAYTVPSYDLRLNPKVFASADSRPSAFFERDAATLARALCQALTDCDAAEEASILAKLKKQRIDKNNKPALMEDVLIRRAREMKPEAVFGVQDLIAAVVKKSRAPQAFIKLVPQGIRFQPAMDLTAQVIGYLDATGTGVSGIEKELDLKLRGTPGKQLTQQDGRSKEILSNVIAPPKPGTTLELTIDLVLQEILTRELKKGIEDAGALGGAAVVLDSATGQVLAMQSLPSFNPNAPGEADPSKHDQRNRVLQDLYEPGSVFKIVTLAAALNEGVVTPDTIIDTNPGWMVVEGRSKRITEDRNHNYGALNIQGILTHSSNVGAARVGLMLGSDLMLQYARAFGIGLKDSDRDFSGERRGRIAAGPGGLRKAELAVVSYGYQVTANPLEIATAMNVFATGGVLLRPQIVLAEIDGDVRRVREPEPLGRAITPQTAATMISMLESVVEAEGGTGHKAALARYQVGGKTGTTKKNVGKGNGYSESDYVVSFVGIAPSRHPRFTIAVVIDRPTKIPAYGGQVSAPVFQRVAEAALNYVGEPPSINPPPAVVLADQRPKNVRPKPVESPVVQNAGGVPVMPDLTGLTLRDAMRRAPKAVTLSAEGDGVVVSQSLPAGEAIATERVVIKLQRVPVQAGGGGR